MANETATPNSKIRKPVEIIGADLYGQQFFESTETETIHRNGISTLLENTLAPDSELIVRNPETGVEAAAVVVGQTRKEASGQVYGLAFLENSPVLWNVDFPAGMETRDVQMECSCCRSCATYSLAGIELEVFDRSGELTHPCKKCNSSSVWRGANREAAAKKVSTAPVSATVAASVSTRDLSSSSIEERRKNKRTTMKLAACVRFAGMDIVVDCEDISKGGFRFTDDKEYPEGTRIETAVPYSKFGTNIFSQGTIIYSRKLPDGRFRHGVAHAKKPESIGWDWVD